MPDYCYHRIEKAVKKLMKINKKLEIVYSNKKKVQVL